MVIPDWNKVKKIARLPSTAEGVHSKDQSRERAPGNNNERRTGKRAENDREIKFASPHKSNGRTDERSPDSTSEINFHKLGRKRDEKRQWDEKGCEKTSYLGEKANIIQATNPEEH